MPSRSANFNPVTSAFLAATALSAAALLSGCSDSADDVVGPAPAPAPADDIAPADGDAPPDDGGGEQSDWATTDLVLLPVAQLSQPTALAARPGDDDLWVLEREGRVRVLERTVDEGAASEEIRLRPEPVLDLSDRVGTDGEGGLLGLAFAADGDELFVHYTDRAGDTVVSSFPVDPEATDPDGEQVLLTVDQPYSNHNGGDVRLGPDGLLYIGLGDGGSANDPEGHGQDRSTLLGSILRIDPTSSGGEPYTVPDSNPFIGEADVRPEIWLYGVRNPWRFSFDPGTGDLWIGDVGQNEVEEIDWLPADLGGGAAANLGWNLLEGNQRFEGDEPADHVAPVHVYTHDEGGCSVTGGEVYRGEALPALDGVYLFSDYCSGGIQGLQPVEGRQPLVAPLRLDVAPGNVIAFGPGDDGEIYVLEQGGRVSRLQPVEPPLTTTIIDG